MKKLSLVMVIIFNYFHVISQNDKYTPNVIPIPPSSFEFLKYGEIPVSEYTGIPNITIPIYTIKDGDLELPISLTYHAGGIRVAEEATWVGLGWQLDVGNITQVVNDRDDLGETTKEMPDYYYYPYTQDFTWRYNYPFNNGNDVPPTNGISQDNPYHSFTVFMDYYFPINGEWVRRPHMFNAESNGHNYIDSEPDIFKANFFGHNLEFIKDFATGSIKLLNRKNYLINPQTNASGDLVWEITAPDGIEYHFKEIEEVKNEKSCSSVDDVTDCINTHEVVSRIWHLTQVVDTKKRSVAFNWKKTSDTYLLPAFSQKVKQIKFSNEHKFLNCHCDGLKIYKEGAGSKNNQTLDCYSVSTNQALKRSYLSSIDFRTGRIDFSVSSRNDIKGDIKLDQIIIKNKYLQSVVRYDFKYAYFEGHNDGGSSQKDFSSYYNKTTEELTKRLKLNSVQKYGDNPYTFKYNKTTLPSKASYGVDYWGFYNGKTTNTSLVPNPVNIDKPEMGDNGNDRRSNLAYSKAGILETIIYPTGGKTTFEYELNSFIPGFYASINTGCGLRIKTLTDYSDSKMQQKTEYKYEDGQLMLPLRFYGSYSIRRRIAVMVFYDYQIKYISGNNFYSSSLLGSGNNVGYGKVTKTMKNSEGETNGWIESMYHNNPDIGAHDNKKDLSLPGRKDHYNPDNGLIRNKKIYNSSGNPVKFIINEYYGFQMSDVYYGAKCIYSNLYTQFIPSNNIPCLEYFYEQDLVGYYPIYSGESLLKSTTTEEFRDNGTVTFTETYTYNSNNLLKYKDITNSNSDRIRYTYLYPNEKPEPYMSDLVSKNVVNRPVHIYKDIDTDNPPYVIPSDLTYEMRESYSNYGGLILLSKVDEKYVKTEPYSETITYDDYDTYGNVMEYHEKDNMHIMYVWGYNNSYPVIKAENCSNNSILTTAVSNSLPDGFSTLDALLDYVYDFSDETKKSTWQSFNSSLRSKNSMNTVMISTYTYKPLVGITSETTPNGITTYYEYDDFSHLKTIKDQNGHIIKEYDYHYKDQ